jgi:hypothetical protein
MQIFAVTAIPEQKSNHNLSVLRVEHKRQERKRVKERESQNIIDEF